MSAEDDINYEDIVTVTAGPWKGTTGCYDDDDDDGRMIVYPGVWLVETYFVVKPKHVRLATADEEKAYYEQHGNDIRTRRAWQAFVARRDAQRRQ